MIGWQNKKNSAGSSKIIEFSYSTILLLTKNNHKLSSTTLLICVCQVTKSSCSCLPTFSTFSTMENGTNWALLSFCTSPLFWVMTFPVCFKKLLHLCGHCHLTKGFHRRREICLKGAVYSIIAWDYNLLKRVFRYLSRAHYMPLYALILPYNLITIVRHELLVYKARGKYKAPANESHRSIS